MPAAAPFAATVPIVRLAGRDDERFVEALLAATLRQAARGPDRVELEVVGLGASGSSAPAFAFDDVELGAAIEIDFGGDTRTTLFRGEITAIEERHGGGAPRLVLLAEDALHRLARERTSRVFAEMSLDDVLSQVAGEAGLRSDLQAGSATADWHQLHESTLAFLRRLVAPLELPLRLVDGETLLARPFAASSDAVALDPGDSVHHLRLVADTAGTITEAKALGRDLLAGEAVEQRSDALEPAPSGTAAADLLARLGWPGPAFAPAPEPAGAAHGEAFAKGRFARANGRFVRGELVCEGEPRLVPGATVELAGLSRRFLGRYLVGSAVHRFDRAHGYQTLAEVARPDLAS